MGVLTDLVIETLSDAVRTLDFTSARNITSGLVIIKSKYVLSFYILEYRLTYECESILQFAFAYFTFSYAS